MTKPNTEIKLETKTYEGEIYCRNCNQVYKRKIPKGTTVQQFCYENICKRCGVRAMSKSGKGIW